ncbi:MAG: sigma-54-dependent Fis family transcriptional regulator [Bacillota bacterium]|nr:sigma-54-dependent Fis family transcriptional regulator [Bacillota bacterium]
MTVNHKNCTIEHLYAVLNSTYNGIIAVDNKGIITLFNRGAANILGIPTEKALGQKIDELFNVPSLLTTVETGLLDVGRKVTINGRSVYSNRSPIIKNGEIVGAVAIFQDTTDVENLTKELADARDSVEILETILENAYDRIVVVDRDGIITKFNKAYQSFLGVEEKDAIGRHVTDVIENTRMHIVVKTGKPEIGEVQKIQGDEMVVMRIPIYKEGKVVGAVGKVLFRDLQEIKALANKLDITITELKYYKKELRRLKGSRYTFKNIVGNSEKIKQVKELARLASTSSSNVLIRGESGTGKELFAHAIHDSSLRRYGAFIRVNCAAIPANLLESELFGYEGGAFTGAKKEGKPGKFELAQGGTIFLDEIGDMPGEMQVKLLRVLQEKEVERIGGDKVIRLDVRIIAATNRDLEEMIEKGEFRQDLYYRLNVLKIEIPPLRELKEDIELLSEKILTELNEELGTGIQGISADVISILRSHSWPGNIRELKNVLERAVNICKSNRIQKKHLPIYLLDQAQVDKKVREVLELQDGEVYSLEGVLASAEKLAIERALKKTQNNRKKAAELLGIHRSGLYQKMTRYNLK